MITKHNGQMPAPQPTTESSDSSGFGFKRAYMAVATLGMSETIPMWQRTLSGIGGEKQKKDQSGRSHPSTRQTPQMPQGPATSVPALGMSAMSNRGHVPSVLSDTTEEEDQMVGGSQDIPMVESRHRLPSWVDEKKMRRVL